MPPVNISQLKLSDALVKSYSEAHHSISLFTRGIRPTFKDKYGYTVSPHNYKQEYEKYFEAILYRHPNEDESIHQWRRATLPIGKAQEPLVNSINRLQSVMFSQDNFEFNSQDENTNAYFAEVKKFFKDHYVNRVEDANGLFAIIDLHETAFVNDAPRPGIIYIESEHILHLDEKSCVFKYKGFYHLLNESAYVRYNENNTIVFGYLHECGKLPVKPLGGIKSGNHFISDFAFYIDWAKDFLQQSSDDRAILKNAAYPIPIMAKEPCTSCHGQKTIAKKECEGQSCTQCSGNGCYDECKTCGGSGELKYFPGRTINFNPSTVGEGGSVKAADLMSWATPDMAPAQHSLERVKYEKEGGEKALNIRNVNAQQSGEAKALDMAYEEANIKHISSNYYDVCSYILDIAIKWLNYKKEVQYSFAKPVNTEIKTPLEITSDYEMLVKINASKSILDKAKLRVIKALYPNDKVLIKKESAAMYIDSLYHDNAQTIGQKELAGIVDKAKLLLHETLSEQLEMLIERIGVMAFMEMSNKEIKQSLSQV